MPAFGKHTRYMKLLSLEPRCLRYFVALAEELNFHRAAQRLHMSSPGLSVQIKKLEETLEVRLCERSTTTRVRLTPVGEVFLCEARELLARMQGTLDTLKEAAQGLRGRLNIGIPGRFSYSFIATTVEAHQQRFPKVDVTLADIYMEGEQQKAVEEGRIDLGFACDFQLPAMKNMESLLVMDMPIQAIMGAQHPLAALKQVPLAELLKHPIFSIQNHASHARNMEALFRKKKLPLKAFKKIDTVDACLSMLSAGQGVTLMPAMRTLKLDPQLALRPVKNAGGEALLRMRVYAVWKPGALPQVLHFAEQLRKTGVQYD